METVPNRFQGWRKPESSTETSHGSHEGYYPTVP